MTPTLLPLYVHPSVDPAAWQAAAGQATALTVVVDDPELTEPAARLAAAGVRVLGRVDVAFATRPIADLLDDVSSWADHPASGIFLDQAPTSPFSLGPVALATRHARRSGLATVVLNPGIPTDPLYRDLGLPLCTFEGPWAEYRRWSGEGAEPGDGHLVHSVPADRLAEAESLLGQRGAGWGLITDRTPPAPYGGLPAWLAQDAGRLPGCTETGMESSSSMASGGTGRENR